MVEMMIPLGVPMLIDLRQMHGEHDRLVRTYAASAFDASQEEYAVAADVALALDVHREGRRYRLVGELRTTLELSCGRCLNRFTQPVELSFALLYLPYADNRGEGEIEIEEEDLATAYYREDQIDLGQLMREQVFLVLPMKPLCGDGCRGLCPVCGINLNEGSCGCVHAWEDPRWASLKGYDRGASG